jgi:hypothetical protein
MPQLIQNIQGEVVSNTVGSVLILHPIVGQIGQSDYIHLNNYVFYLQDFSKTELLENIEKPAEFGLKNIKEMVTIEISY